MVPFSVSATSRSEMDSLGVHLQRKRMRSSLSEALGNEWVSSKYVRYIWIVSHWNVHWQNASTNGFQEAWCSHRYTFPSTFEKKPDIIFDVPDQRAISLEAAHPKPPEWRERLSTSSIDFPQALEYEWVSSKYMRYIWIVSHWNDMTFLINAQSRVIRYSRH